MIPWVLLEKVALPGRDKELRLYQRDTEFVIKVNSYILMNSREHNSEDELARLACQKIAHHKTPHILIGGLGMGFTLRAALTNFKARGHVTVAELIPAVVEWNRTYLAHLAGDPLKDKRVSIYEGDVVDKIKSALNFYHAILLDVDNGAQGMTQTENDRLYSQRGLRAAYAALHPGGVLAIWSAGPDIAFENRLAKTNFTVETLRVRTRNGRRGGSSIIWLAVK